MSYNNSEIFNLNIWNGNRKSDRDSNLNRNSFGRISQSQQQQQSNSQKNSFSHNNQVQGQVQQGQNSNEVFQYTDLFDDINNEVGMSSNLFLNLGNININQSSANRLSNDFGGGKNNAQSPSGFLNSGRFSWNNKEQNENDFNGIIFAGNERDSFDRVLKNMNQSNRNTINSRRSNNSLTFMNGNPLEEMPKLEEDALLVEKVREIKENFEQPWNQQSQNNFYQQHLQQNLGQQIDGGTQQQGRSSLFQQRKSKLSEISEEKLNKSIESGRISFPTFNFGGDSRGGSLQQQLKQECIKEIEEEEDKKENKIILDGCTCKKSRCLKLYCECFAKGKECDERCKCSNCLNNIQFSEREQALQLLKLKQMANHIILQEKPFTHFDLAQQLTLNEPNSSEENNITQNEENASSSNLISTLNGNSTLASGIKKGCNCKKTKCLKKYCECYNLKIACNSSCNCERCENGAYGPFGEMNPANIEKKQQNKIVISHDEVMEMINKKIKTLIVEDYSDSNSQKAVLIKQNSQLVRN